MAEIHRAGKVSRAAVLKESRRIEEDSMYSARGHFEAAHLWGRVHLWVGLPAAVLAAVSGVSALSEFDHHGVVAGILALLVAVATGVMTFLNPSDRSQQHLGFGNRYNSLKNTARRFCEIESAVATDPQIVSELRTLAATRDELNQKAPQVPRWAYQRAKKAIAAGEAAYAADAPAQSDEKKVT